MPRCNIHNKYYPDQMDRCETCQVDLDTALQPSENMEPVVTVDDLRHNETLAAIIASGLAHKGGFAFPPLPELLVDWVIAAKVAGALVSERYAVEVVNRNQ